MLFYFVALLSASIIVILNNYKNETYRWAALFLCSASVGGLYDFFIARRLLVAAEVIQFINYTLTPYSVLMFCILYASVFPLKRSRRNLKLLLLLPPIIMVAIATLTPEKRLFFILLLLWSAPYYLASCWLLIRSYWREKERRLKRNRFITTIIFVPTLLAVLFFIYVAKVFSPNFDFFNYISVFMIYSLGVALLCTFIYGVLGVKVKFEHDPLESTMKAVSIGTSLLNHTIKNEIGKISISTENIKGFFPESNEHVQQHMQIITNSSSHMLAMVNRIHSQMKDIVLKEEPCQLNELMDAVLVQNQGLLYQQGVTVTTAYHIYPLVMCDSVHVSEALGNLIMNACEAMLSGGVIQIGLQETKRGISLSIQDSGVGIPADKLAQVFDPFFSNGKAGRNFGLGLSYVYNVLLKSGGTVDIASREGGGTCVTLFWPRKKVIRG